MENTLSESLENINGAPKATSLRKKASNDLVLAAQLNQARETIIALRKHVSDQDQTIVKLQRELAAFEVSNIQNENEKLRETHGLKVGQRLDRDESGQWWVVTEPEAKLE